MKKIILTLLLAAYCCYLCAQTSSLWSDLKFGKYGVGFRTIRMKDENNTPLLISLWYPAVKGNDVMSLKDLILSGNRNENIPDSVLLNEFKSITGRIYDLDNISKATFDEAISIKTITYRDAEMQDGKFPLIIASAGPASYFETFEYFASNGFAVASVTAEFKTDPPSTDGPMHYTRYTDVLNQLLEYMYKQSYVDNTDITAFGHGGGIQTAVYLAMRTSKIKRVINLDGGFFGPRSKTTLSIDYHPEKFAVPLLHIITASTFNEDDSKQFAALTNPITRVKIKTEDFRHHDFTAWGRVVAVGLKMRGEETEEVNRIFTSIHQLMLDFLLGKKLSTNNNSFFAVEKFN